MKYICETQCSRQWHALTADGICSWLNSYPCSCSYWVSCRSHALLPLVLHHLVGLSWFSPKSPWFSCESQSSQWQAAVICCLLLGRSVHLSVSQCPIPLTACPHYLNCRGRLFLHIITVPTKMETLDMTRATSIKITVISNSDVTYTWNDCNSHQVRYCAHIIWQWASSKFYGSHHHCHNIFHVSHTFLNQKDS